MPFIGLLLLLLLLRLGQKGDIATPGVLIYTRLSEGWWHYPWYGYLRVSLPTLSKYHAGKHLGAL